MQTLNDEKKIILHKLDEKIITKLIAKKTINLKFMYLEKKRMKIHNEVNTKLMQEESTINTID